MRVELVVNGRERHAEVSGPQNLLDVLRDDLGLLGSKGACEEGECGSCSVLLDERVVCSCLVMAVDAHGASVVTVEGLGSGDALHPVQEALAAAGAVQCGFCTPGFAVAAAALFATGGAAEAADLEEALAGNICRCTGYGAMRRAFGGGA